MPQWFLPYTAAALVAAALGWLATSYDPDAGHQTATPVLAGAPAPDQPGTQQASVPAQDDGAEPAPAAATPAAEAPAPDSSSDEEAAVRQLVVTAMTTSRPEDCTRLYTQAFLEQITGEVGSEAIEECKDDSDEDASADSVNFKSLVSTGGGYQAVVDLVGGDMGGSLFTMAINRTTGVWKIDRLVDIDVDMDQQAQAAGDQLREEGFGSADVACYEEEVRKADEDAYEQALLEGRGSEYAQTVLGSAVDCMSADALRDQVVKGIRRSVPPDIPGAIVECVVDQLNSMSDSQIRALLKTGHDGAREFGRQAFEGCARSLGYAS